MPCHARGRRVSDIAVTIGQQPLIDACQRVRSQCARGIVRGAIKETVIELRYQIARRRARSQHALHANHCRTRSSKVSLKGAGNWLAS